MFICFSLYRHFKSTYIKVFKLNNIFFPLLSVCFLLLFRYCHAIEILCIFGVTNIETAIPYIFIFLLSNVT